MATKIKDGAIIELSAEEEAALAEKKANFSPATLDDFKDLLLSRFDRSLSIDKVQFKALLNHENRIRALEGKNPIDAQQMKQWIRSQID